MAGTLAPLITTVFDNSGLIVSGAKIYAYVTGTTTKQNTYTSAALSVANANPIVCDSAGRATIFLDPSLPNYDLVFCPSNAADPPLTSYYTLTNISAVPSDDEAAGDITVTAGENITAGQWCYLSLGDGGRTTGRWYKTDADLTYASVNATALGVATADITSGSTGNVRIQGQYTAASGLTAGATYFLSGTAGAITTTIPALARPVAVAYSTTAYTISFRQNEVNPDEVWALGGGTVAVGDWAYQARDTSGGNTVGRWYGTNAANAYSSVEPTAIGVVTVALSNGGIGKVQRTGVYYNSSGLTAASRYYLASGSSGITTSAPPNAQVVAVALTTTSYLIMAESLYYTPAVKFGLIGTPTGTGTSLVLANAPAFTAVPTFTPGAGATAATVSGCVYMNTTSTNSTNAGFQALVTETLDANTLNANGKAVRITTWGTSAANANAKSVGIYFGNAGDDALVTIPANYTDWRCQCIVVRTGASAQVNNGIAYSTVSPGTTPSVQITNTTPAEDTTAAINISATCNTTTAADVVLKGMMIEVLN